MKTYKIVGILAAISVFGFLMGACTNDSPEVKDSEIVTPVSPEEPDEPAVPEEPYVETRSAEQLERDFSIALFKEIFTQSNQLQSPSNLCVSPFSAYNLLAMIMSGDSGESGKALVRLLIGSPDKKEEVLRHLKSVTDALISRNTDNFDEEDLHQNLSIANSIWYSPTLKLTETFAGSLDSFAGLELYAQNPSGENGRELINAWASEYTNGMIPELLSEPLMNVDALLANAVHFIATWINEFNHQLNAEGEFININGRSGKATYMKGSEYTYYYEDQDLQMLKKQLGRDYAIRFFLPKENVELANIVSVLSAGTLEEMKGKEIYADVTMEIPKFSYSASVELRDIICGMLGREDLECGDMFENYAGGLSSIMQSFNIGLDEKGVEAAAVTVGLLCSGLPKDEIPHVSIKLNRPFLYIIEDTVTKTILFMGTVTKLG